MTFFALWGVLAFSVAIAFTVGLLVEEIAGRGPGAGFAALLTLVVALAAGLNVVL